MRCGSVLVVLALFGCSKPSTPDAPLPKDLRSLQVPISSNSAKYATGCSTPLKNWMTDQNGVKYHLRGAVVFEMRGDGSLKYDGRSLSDKQLRGFMDATTGSDQPQIVLEVAPSADCSRVEEIRSLIDSYPTCHLEWPLCGEGHWMKWKHVGGP